MSKDTLERNLIILEECMSAFNQLDGPRVGDFLLMPNGKFTRFTHKWDDHMQTGGHTQSQYYLGPGYLSYSGGLDPGIKIKEIELTEMTKNGKVWFFSEGHAGADNDVSYMVQFRVYTCKPDADLTGLFEYANDLKQQIKDQTEHISLINGNGARYEIPLPEIVILSPINEIALNHITITTGIRFSFSHGYYHGQPMKHHQILSLIAMYNWNVRPTHNHKVWYFTFNQK